MKEPIENFGIDAGKIWLTLNKYGPLSINTLQKNTRIPENNFYAAVGWLAQRK